MKNQLTLVKSACAALLACTAGYAVALDSQSLAVSATVSGICKFSSTSTPLAFGTIDPSLATDKVVPANVKYKCTKGTASLGVAATGGTTRTLTGVTASNLLNYSLAFSGGTQTGTGFGAGQDLTLVVTGTITAAQYQNVAADTYSESVTLNITP